MPMILFQVMALSHHDDVSAHLSEERNRRSSHCSRDAGKTMPWLMAFRGPGAASQERGPRPLNTEECGVITVRRKGH